jgi:hypothetical protein
MFWIHHAFVDKLWAMQQDCRGVYKLTRYDASVIGRHLSTSTRIPQVGSTVGAQINLVKTGVKYTLGRLHSDTSKNCKSWPSFVSGGDDDFLQTGSEEEEEAPKKKKGGLFKALARLIMGLRRMCQKLQDKECKARPRPALPKNWCVMNNIPQDSGKCGSSEEKEEE